MPGFASTMRLAWLSCLPISCRAFIKVPDLDDLITSSDFVGDNQISPSYTFQNPVPVLPLPDVSFAHLVAQPQAFDHSSWNISQDQTCALVVSGVSFNASFSEVVKEGKPKDVWSSEIVGQNAALLFTNQSSGSCSFCNITTHNGAIAAISTVMSVMDLIKSSIYTTGPTAHGMWASLEGAIRGELSFIQTNGLRSSAVGVGVNGSADLSSSSIHTTGLYSSPLFFATGGGGSLHCEVIVGNADASPIAIVDGSADVWIGDSVLTGGGIAGIVSTNTGQSAGSQVLQFNNNWLTSAGGGPAMWFGNTNATVQLYRSRVTTLGSGDGHGILAIANRSQTNPDYSSYGSGSPLFSNLSISPAWVQFDIQETVVQGDIISMLGSYIRWSLAASTVWYGSALVVNSINSVSLIDIALAPDCTWVLTQNSVTRGFYAPGKNLTNIVGNGFNVSYARTHAMNAWLGGEMMPLTNGGFAIPY